MTTRRDSSSTRGLPALPCTTTQTTHPGGWPKPPLSYEHPPSLSQGAAEPCRIEMSDGSAVEGLLVAMDPEVGIVSLRSEHSSRFVPFARMQRLTLTNPLRPALQAGKCVASGHPHSAEEREYRLKSVVPGQGPMVGRTLGYVQAREGFYLFAPDGRGGVLRVFVPRLAFSDYQFGPFADDVPGRREIADPDELLQAIERQRTLRVLPLGHSLIALALITPSQLKQALARQSPAQPLGEFLVGSGQISASDLERAIAHKMGYPLVDLVHFPIDKRALRQLTLRTAVSMRAAPVLTDAHRLIVAVSKVSRADRLRGLSSVLKKTLVPVLAPKNRIMDTLTRMSEHQLWEGVPLSMGFFQTTT